MQQQYSKWNSIDTSTLATGKDDKGVRYLSLFARDYQEVFNEGVNVGCRSCIDKALKHFKSKIMSTERDTKARLKAKYNNIGLGFGTGIVVNNDNITLKTAKQLLKNRGEQIFEVLPEQPKPTTKKTTTKKKFNAKK